MIEYATVTQRLLRGGAQSLGVLKSWMEGSQSKLSKLRKGTSSGTSMVEAEERSPIKVKGLTRSFLGSTTPLGMMPPLD